MARENEKAARCAECGNLSTDCQNPEAVWYPHRLIDYAVMERAGAEARYDAQWEDRPYHDGTFEKSPLRTKERTPATPYHYKDGVTIVVATTNLAPDDEFLSLREVVNCGDEA